MKMLALLLLLSYTAGSAPPRKSAYNDQQVIQYTKIIDVARLDTSLPSQGLEEWLRTGRSRLTEVRWRVSAGCDLKSEATKPANRRRLCVKLTFSRGDVSGWGLITIGTVGQGITGNPRFDYAVVSSRNLSHEGRHATITMLSKLPDVLAQYQTGRTIKQKALVDVRDNEPQLLSEERRRSDSVCNESRHDFQR